MVITAPVRSIASRTAAAMSFGIVADRGAMHDLHADRCERAREIGGVGVDGEAEQQLVTDGENFYLAREICER